MTSTPTVKRQFAFGSSPQASPGITHDLSSLHPKYAVIFKGLQKRDATTKIRASEELLASIDDIPEASDDDESLIKVWMSMYPTLAIDVDRRVRANAHTILGKLIQKYQKKTVKHLQSIAASWLIGQHDNDRLVSRAACEAFDRCFTTENKRADFRKLFKTQITERCQDLAFDQTAATMSDSRFVTKDDADAKYSNVVSAAASVLAQLSSDGIEDMSNYLTSKSFWNLVVIDDPSIQRSLLIFLKSIISAQTISQYAEDIATGVSSLLAHTSPACVIDVIIVLQLIADIDCDLIFLDKITTKKPISKRLLAFIKKAATPAASTKYWQSMSLLLQKSTRCSDHSDEVITPYLTAFSESVNSASNSQRAPAIDANAQLLVHCIGKGSRYATVAYQTSIINHYSDLPAFATSLIKLHAIDASLLNSLLPQVNDKFAELLTSSETADLETLNKWLVTMKGLTDAGCNEVQVAVFFSRCLKAALNAETIAFPFIKAIVSSFPDLLDDDTKEDELAGLLVYRSRAVKYPKETGALISSLPTKSSQVTNTLLQDLPHEPSSMLLVQSLVSSNIKSEAVNSWLEQNLYQSSTLDEASWSTYVSSLRSQESPAILYGLLELVKEHPEHISKLLELLEMLIKEDSPLVTHLASLGHLASFVWTEHENVSPRTADLVSSLLGYRNGELTQVLAKSYISGLIQTDHQAPRYVAA